MLYMLLIYGDESHWGTQSEDEQQGEFGKYQGYTQALRDRGALVAADPLQPTTTATTVRVRDGETLTTDGPFAETKEQLGGYYIIEVDSLDEAIEWAAKVPAAQGGSIEVRPVMPMPAELPAGLAEARGDVMQYMLLIYSASGHWESLSDDERETIYEDYYKLSDQLRERDALIGSHELQGTETARSVRVRDGEKLVSDGPFAETKEALGGYYLIEADSVEEAEEWAARIPSARHGIVEVRPVVMRHVEVGA